MKTIIPKSAVTPDHDESVASAKSATSSASVSDPTGNPMSDAGSVKASGVHAKSSDAGKFDFGFMGNKDDEEKFDVPVHATGAFPIAGGKEEPYAKPTHAPGTYASKK